MAPRKRNPGKAPARKSPSPRASGPARSYEDMHGELDDEHPVDALVERRLEHAALRRRIRTATARLTEVLGDERDLWLRLEELLGEQRLDREAAYFDIGYEHGRAAGRAEALADGKRRGSPAYRALAQKVRETAVNAGLSHQETVSALLEAAWALVADGSATTSRRR